MKSEQMTNEEASVRFSNQNSAEVINHEELAQVSWKITDA